MQFSDSRVHCPMCDSLHIQIDEQNDDLWYFHILECCCVRCSCTFSVVYQLTRVKDVRYGEPIGPVCLTDDPQQELAAWEADEAQWIRTDGTQYAIGYEPTIRDGRKGEHDWRDTSPDELDALLVHLQEGDPHGPR